MSKPKVNYEDVISGLVTSFETFIVEMIKQDGFTVSEKNQFLSPKTLWHLSDQLHFKSPNVTPYSLQPSHHLVHLLYNLTTSGKFGQLDGSKGKTRLVANEDFFDQFCELPLPARYAFLLEIFWCRIDLDEVISIFGVQDIFDQIFTLSKKSKPGTQVVPRNSRLRNTTDQSSSIYIHGLPSYCLWFFGFFEMELPEKGEKIDKYTFPGNHIEVTPFGKKLAQILSKDRPYQTWNLKYRFLFGDDIGIIAKSLPPFHKAFVPLFGEGAFANTLTFPEPISALGAYRLKISLAKDLYRVIDIPASATFSELHNVIQQLYEFDDDHLYSFFLGKPNSRRDPGIDGSPYEHDDADEKTLGSQSLFKKQSFRYVFDFGDNWEFTIKVMDHYPDENSEVAKLIKSVGDAPDQYDWDEDEYDEED